MKKYLIVDTETTGLPISYTVSFQDTDNWPRIIELSWELCWENGETIEKACDLIYPDGTWRFPTGDFWKENGFTEDESLLSGIPIADALLKLGIAMNCADVMVCHNLSYDKPIIECEFFRANMFPKAIRRQLIENNIKLKVPLRDENVKLQKECTKLLSTPILKLPGFKGNYSWPKLEAAYQYMFGEPMTGAHHASSDVEATKKVYLWIRNMNDIL
jgi:DNA polymerase-3 subunit alpha